MASGTNHAQFKEIQLVQFIYQLKVGTKMVNSLN